MNIFSNSEKRIMGIDFGEKRIGIALTDPLLTFAYAFKTLNNDKNFWKEFKSIIEEKNVYKIILGFPSQEYEASKKLGEKINTFKEECIARFGLEILLRDEQYTSVMAKDLILKSVTKKSKRRDKALLDQNSAAIILQEYLDEQ